jgi:hypothetical protein
MPQAREAAGLRSLKAYPNMRVAAEILGVAASTLSRRKDIKVEARGARDRVLSAGEMLRLGSIFRKRSLNDVAYDLLEHAQRSAPEDAGRVQEEIEEYFDSEIVGETSREQLVTLAHRMLSATLCEQIEAELSTDRTPLPDVIQGYFPTPED